jgi:crotonobetainyl-CoA:carnitine CoA-transferase CaiB-like acyl-CoA transferase
MQLGAVFTAGAISAALFHRERTCEAAEIDNSLDMIVEVEVVDGGPPMKIVRNPIQFNHEPVVTTRAPQASEHTETFLMEPGMEWDKIEALKAAGAIA